MTETPDKSMDEIMASIRKIVEDGPAPEPDPAEDVPPPRAAHTPPPAALPAADTTLEALVRSMLEPQLKAWLDAHLPELIEQITRDQIARLTQR